MKKTDKAMTDYRLRQRRLAFVERGGAGAKCDYCIVQGKESPNKATDYHEVVNRGRTMNNDEQRKLSYDRHICSCLCSECHIGINVHRPELGTALLLHNIQLYGGDYTTVKAAWDAANEAGLTPLSIDFPEREDWMI
jgi:hypothetical protein